MRRSLAPLVLFVTASCAGVLSLGDYRDAPAEGSGGAGGVGGSGGGDICADLSLPSPAASAPEGSDLDIVLAVRAIDLGKGGKDEPATVGLDLDGRLTTCDQENAGCVVDEVAKGNVCDGVCGQDNAIAAALEVLTEGNERFASPTLSAAMDAGEFTFLVRIRDYNGEPNDNDLRVSLYSSVGFDEDNCNDPGSTPDWDGTDRWSISPRSLIEGGGDSAPDCDFVFEERLDSPRHEDVTAYVRDGILVARLPEASLELSALGLIKLNGGVVRAELVRKPVDPDDADSPKAWRLERGLLAGKWREEDLLGALPNLLNIGGLPACPNDPATGAIYAFAKTNVCNFRDTLIAEGTPGQRCDGFSYGLAFEAMQAQLGSVFGGEDPSSACSPEPPIDRCDILTPGVGGAGGGGGSGGAGGASNGGVGMGGRASMD